MVTRRTPQKGKHLTEAQKAEAAALWESGNFTLEDLAARFKKDPSTMKKLFDRVGAVKGAKAVENAKKVAEKIEEKIITGADLLAQRVTETKEEVYKMSAGLRKLMWVHVTKARAEGRSIASVINEIKTLKEAAALLKITREESYIALGLDKDNDGEENELPELIFHQLADEEIRELIAKQTDPDAVEETLEQLDEAIAAADIEEVDGESEGG